MARKVYFAFDYEDIKDFRASVVRNSWVTQLNREDAGFWDSADWEKVRKQGKEAIKRWIDRQLEGTTVTAVLIGTHTSEREWVTYEIQKSYEKGKGLLGIQIHNIKDKFGFAAPKGPNPLANLHLTRTDGTKVFLSQIYNTYDWVYDDGYNNFGKWVEAAARTAGL